MSVPGVAAARAAKARSRRLNLHLLLCADASLLPAQPWQPSAGSEPDHHEGGGRSQEAPYPSRTVALDYTYMADIVAPRVQLHSAATGSQEKGGWSSQLVITIMISPASSNKAILRHGQTEDDCRSPTRWSAQSYTGTRASEQQHGTNQTSQPAVEPCPSNVTSGPDLFIYSCLYRYLVLGGQVAKPDLSRQWYDFDINPEALALGLAKRPFRHRLADSQGAVCPCAKRLSYASLQVFPALALWAMMVFCFGFQTRQSCERTILSLSPLLSRPAVTSTWKNKAQSQRSHTQDIGSTLSGSVTNSRCYLEWYIFPTSTQGPTGVNIVPGSTQPLMVQQ